MREAKYNWDNCVGIIKYTKGKWKGFRYEGEFSNGLMHGKGVALHPSGGKYQGEVNLVKEMVLENMLGLMVTNILESGKMTKNTVTVLIFI